MNDPLIQPEVIPLHAAAADPIGLPEPATLFGDRARRFERWADRQPAQRDFFGFLAALSRAQGTVSAGFVPRDLPDAVALARCHAHRMPPLPASLVDPPDDWIRALRAVLAACERTEATASTDAARAARRLDDASDAELATLGAALLAFDYDALPVDAAPWVAAGLQVWWSTAAAALGREVVRPIDVRTVCPCCGSLPVASLRRIGGLRQGLRYLVCSLCATQWHMVRVKCSHCESTKGIGYLALSDAADDGSTMPPNSTESAVPSATHDVVKAEVCDECASYLKLISLESDAEADPVADDLATLALDVLTDERGYARIGPNLLIHPGVSA